MAVDMKKLKGKFSDHRNRMNNQGKKSTFGIGANESKYFGLCWPHENMGGLPWVDRLYHQRDLPQGVKGNFSIPCMRDSYEDDSGKCPKCKERYGYIQKRVEKDDKWDKEAKRLSPRRKPICQVYDLTPLFNNKGKMVKKMKSCFLKFGKKDDCEGCYLAESCEKGVQKWYTPVRVWEEFEEHFNDEGDITDPNRVIPLRITRKGKGVFDTRYSMKAFSKSAFELSKGIVKRMNKQLIDLSSIDPKPEGTWKQLKKKYDDFYELNDIDNEHGDDDDPVKDKKKDKKKKKNKKKKKDTDKLRDDMKKDAKAGKMDRKKKRQQEKELDELVGKIPY